MNPKKNTSAEARPASSAKRTHGVQGGSGDANRLAVIVLEVLAGVRTPQEAASVLSVTLPRYYQLEVRALEGLVAALEPRRKVRQPSPERRIAQLEKALSESHRDCARQQALVRAAQRSLGIKPPATIEGKPPGKDKHGRRKRRPTVRALKAAKVLANSARSVEEIVLQSPELADRSTESVPHGNGTPPSDPTILSQGMVG
jgi:hypothetical protein